MLYVIMKDIKSKSNTITSYRVGLFHTKAGAERVARRLGRNKPNGTRYRVIADQWYINKMFAQRVKKWKDKRNLNKYNKLLRKRNGLNSRIIDLEKRGVQKCTKKR